MTTPATPEAGSGALASVLVSAAAIATTDGDIDGDGGVDGDALGVLDSLGVGDTDTPLDADGDSDGEGVPVDDSLTFSADATHFSFREQEPDLQSEFFRHFLPTAHLTHVFPPQLTSVS